MIRLMIPTMPKAHELLPYLKTIDGNRWYTNHGPVSMELEKRLGHMLAGLPCHVVSNGTHALQLLLQAVGATGDVLVPAMTFSATGLAIKNAGCRPILCDIDESNWMLTPEIAEAILRTGLQFGAIVPVATFGVPVDIELWARLANRYSVPVVVDGAGALTDQPVGFHKLVHLAFSLHATKFIGCGEGGIIATTDWEVMARARQLSNFGLGGTNAKMSEYHAAVTLASLDASEDKRGRTWELWDHYEARLKTMRVFLQADAVFDRTILPVLLPPDRKANDAIAHLLNDGIESKQWYRPFLDELWPTVTLLCEITITHALRDRMIGLPFHLHMSTQDVDAVCDSLERFVA